MPSAAIAPARRNCIRTSCAQQRLASSWSSKRRPVSRARYNNSGGAVQVSELAHVLLENRPGSIGRSRNHDFRFGRICAQRLLIAALSAKTEWRVPGRRPANRPHSRNGGSQRICLPAWRTRPCAHGNGGSPEAAANRAASLIGAPTDIGASDRGASMGPEALRVAGITRV